MFKNLHSMHNYITINEGKVFIRKKILTALNKNLLQKDYTEIPILKLKEALLTLEKQKQEILSQVETKIEEIIVELNNKKREILDKINEKIEREIKIIKEREALWLEKEHITHKILEWNCNRNNSDELLLINSKEILNGLEIIEENYSSIHVKQFFELNTKMRICFKNIENKKVFSSEKAENMNIGADKNLQKSNVNRKEEYGSDKNSNSIINHVNNIYESIYGSIRVENSNENCFPNSKEYCVNGSNSKNTKFISDSNLIYLLNSNIIEFNIDDINKIFDDLMRISEGLPIEIKY